MKLLKCVFVHFYFIVSSVLRTNEVPTEGEESATDAWNTATEGEEENVGARWAGDSKASSSAW